MDKRSRAVARFLDLRASDPAIADRILHQRIAQELGCSQSSVRVWAKSFALDGAAGLTDNYTARPRAAVHLDPAVAQDAVIICAWWAFRCGTGLQPVDGGEPVIDGPLINQAASIFSLRLPPSAFRLSDVIAAIDCYYSWPCDRNRYPFKPFSRWVRHDFETWLFRAARKDVTAGKQYTHELPAAAHPTAPAGAKKVSLQTTETVIPPRTPDPHTRAREARWSRNRRAGHRPADPSRPGAPGSGAESSFVQSTIDSRRAGRQSTMTSWLASLPDPTRVMLLTACKRNAAREALQQVSATLPLWWESAPEATRHSIDARIAEWTRDHPQSATPPACANRRAALLLAAIRREWRDAATTLGQLTDSLARKAVAE